MIYAIIFQEFASNPVVDVCMQTGQFVSRADNGFSMPETASRTLQYERPASNLFSQVYLILIIQLFLKKSQEFFLRALKQRKHGFKTPLIFDTRCVKIHRVRAVSPICLWDLRLEGKSKKAEWRRWLWYPAQDESKSA